MPVNITDFLNKKSDGLKKRDLVKSPNLKTIFNVINQHLYGKLKYTDTDTRARSKQIINLLLCKLVDEVSKNPEEEMEFCIKNSESPENLYYRIQKFFDENVRAKYKEVLDQNEQIKLTEELVYLIVSEIQHISLLRSSKDIFSDAFEIFVSKILKDEAGQFFTPPNIVKFMVHYLDPELETKILDPACGHGGFLLESKDLLWSKCELESDKIDAISKLYGIDKDLFLAKISRLYLDILSNGKSNIFCEDSLDPKNYRAPAKEFIKNDNFELLKCKLREIVEKYSKAEECSVYKGDKFMAIDYLPIFDDLLKEINVLHYLDVKKKLKGLKEYFEFAIEAISTAI